MEPWIVNMNFDTKMPLNVADDDIWPGMTSTPVERERPTDMIFDITRYEIGSSMRQIKRNMATPCSAEVRDKVIDELRDRLETKYLRYCDMSVPLEWVTVNICRLVSCAAQTSSTLPLQR